MRKLIGLLLFLAISTAVLGINSKFQENVGKNTKGKVQKAIQEKNLFQDLKSNYYNYANLKYLKATTNDLKVCDLLDSKDLAKDLKGQDAFYYYKFANEAKCDKIQISAEKNKSIANGINSEDLTTFYHEVVVGFLYKSLDQAQIQTVCAKVTDFLEPSGAAKVSKKKNADSSYEDTHKILNVALSCFENGVEDSTNLKSALKKAIGSIVLNSLQINKDTRAIFDGKCPVSTTASILHYVKLLSKYVECDDFANSYPEFLNYLSEAALGTTCPKGVYSIFRAFNTFVNFPLVSLDPKPVLSKKAVIVAYCKNVYEEPVTPGANLKIKGQVSLNGKNIGTALNFEVKNGKLQADFDANGLTELRFYDIQISLSDSSNDVHYSTVKAIGITTKVSVQNFKFEVVQSKVAPKVLSNEVSYGQTFKENVSANQNSFIHIQFELKYDDKKAVHIKQIAVRLRHPENRFSTNLVNAVYDSSQNFYKAVIDLGDPDHSNAYNALYKAELIIADELLVENIRWTFANFDISFSKPLKHVPLTDADYVPLPLIAHRFPSERNPPPAFITLTFCAAIGAVALLFLGLLKGIDVNFSRFPSTVKGGFFAFLFILVVFGHIGLLCLFWVKINLIETLAILTLLFIPTILIGNEGLVSLNLEQEVGEVKEVKE